MTKYPFPHNLVHLQVNSDQNTQGKVYLKQETKKKSCDSEYHIGNTIDKVIQNL